MGGKAGKFGIDDRVWQRIRAAALKTDRAHVKVGVLASKGGNAAHDDSGITMTELAAIHEFGSPAAGIPERSFIRRTFHAKTAEMRDVTAKLARGLVLNKITVARALNILGAWGAAEVKKTVTEGAHIPPPLSKRTIERKKSDRPLIDTGRMIDSVQWEVDMSSGGESEE